MGPLWKIFISLSLDNSFRKLNVYYFYSKKYRIPARFLNNLSYWLISELSSLWIRSKSFITRTLNIWLVIVMRKSINQSLKLKTILNIPKAFPMIVIRRIMRRIIFELKNEFLYLFWKDFNFLLQLFNWFFLIEIVIKEYYLIIVFHKYRINDLIKSLIVFCSLYDELINVF